MDEASRCNRVALMQEGRILAIDEPGKIGRLFKYPLFAVKRAEGLKLINALRKYPHARSVYPFGEDLHYADMFRVLAVSCVLVLVPVLPHRASSSIVGFLCVVLFADGMPEIFSPRRGM